MRIRKFTTAAHYIANYGQGDRVERKELPVPFSSESVVFSSLKNSIKDNQVENFQSLLKNDFIFSTPLSIEWVTIHSSMYNGQGQRNDEKYSYHQVVSTLEALIVHYSAYYHYFYNLTCDKPACREALLDFSGLDLSNADLTGIDFSVARFYGTDLTQTKGITQNTLDQCVSYDFAKLPVNITQLWSAIKAQKVLDDLVKLKKYGTYLTFSNDSDTKTKGKLLRDHADLLINNVLYAPKHDKTFEEEFLKMLTQHNKNFDEPRYYGLKKILANIAFCVLGAGVFYAAAVGLHYAATGRTWFFSRTASRELIDQTTEDLTRPQFSGA